MTLSVKINFDSVKSMVDHLIAGGQTFDIISTGYSKRILWAGESYNFLETDGNKLCFSLFKRLRNDIQQSGIHTDPVPQFDIRYFSVNKYLKRKNLDVPKEIICIDINSAYLSVLKKFDLITQETFDAINAADKPTRLKTVGMLATQKVIMSYEDGKYKGIRTEVDEQLRNVFFYCCYEIGEVMQSIARHHADNFLFFWVDGIYLNGKANYQNVLDYLYEKKYKAGVERLIDPHFETRNDLLLFSYSKGTDRKDFSIPFDNSENKKRLNAYLASIKKRDEANTIQKNH